MKDEERRKSGSGVARAGWLRNVRLTNGWPIYSRGIRGGGFCTLYKRFCIEIFFLRGLSNSKRERTCDAKIFEAIEGSACLFPYDAARSSVPLARVTQISMAVRQRRMLCEEGVLQHLQNEEGVCRTRMCRGRWRVVQ